MTAKGRRPVVAPAALLPTVVVIGLLVLVWAATTGPVRMLRGSGRTHPIGTRIPPAPTVSGTADPGNLREATKDVQPQFHLAWLGDLIMYALFLGACLVALLAVRWLWLHRWRPPEKPVEVEFEVLPGAIIEALRHDVDAQLAAVEQGDARNGIVACWLRLQEIVAAAGLPPHPSETSAEFVVRTLKALDLDPRAIGTLAALYREARFSEHEIGEDGRTAARSALHVLHDDLRVRGAVS